jgi:hypothetical protein
MITVRRGGTEAMYTKEDCDRRFSAIVDRLLLPTGVVPSCVAEVTEDIRDVASSLFSKRYNVKYPDVWGCWSDVLAFCSSIANYFPLGTSARIRTITDSYSEDLVLNVLKSRLTKIKVTAKTVFEEFDGSEIHCIESEERTDVLDMAETVIHYHIITALKVLCTGDVPMESREDGQFPLDVPDWSFHLRFSEKALEVYEQGLWPYGWVWDSDTSGRFLAFRNTLRPAGDGRG